MRFSAPHCLESGKDSDNFLGLGIGFCLNSSLRSTILDGSARSSNMVKSKKQDSSKHVNGSNLAKSSLFARDTELDPTLVSLFSSAVRIPYEL